MLYFIRKEMKYNVIFLYVRCSRSDVMLGGGGGAAAKVYNL